MPNPLESSKIHNGSNYRLVPLSFGKSSLGIC